MRGVDVFLAGYLAISIALVAQQWIFSPRFAASEKVRRIFYSLDIDPAFSRWTAVLGLAEIAVYVDYLRWHLAPALDRVELKAAGLVLYLATGLWLAWVDRFLFRHFAAAHERGVLLSEGPFTLVRHPRYTGLLFTRIAMPLMLASPIAWALCAMWVALIFRRTAREEAWLRARFGAEYDRYAAAKPRLIPQPFRISRFG